MSTSLSQRLWPACLSALELDRYRLGELEPAPAEAVRAHLPGCARCAVALAGLSQDLALPPLRALAAAPALRALPDLDLPRPARAYAAPRRRWQLATLSAGLAAAASLVLVARVPGERSKGAGPALAMFVQHQSAVRRAGPGETVAPGDAVRFAVSTRKDSFVAVLSLDAAGRGSVYFPLGARAEKLPAGQEVPLPLGTRLDATVGEEHLAGLFCPSAVELEPLRAGLERGKLDLPPGCEVVRWSFVKR